MGYNSLENILYIYLEASRPVFESGDCAFNPRRRHYFFIYPMNTAEVTFMPIERLDRIPTDSIRAYLQEAFEMLCSRWQ